MIRNVIFDMGGVLIHWDPGKLTSCFGLPWEDEKLLQNELFRGVEWVQLDRGVIGQEEAAERVNRRLPSRLHSAARETITGWWHRTLVPMEGMEELVRELKEADYGIYLLSNASPALRNYFHRIPGSQYFDGILVSGEEKLLKPQHEIYECLYQRFALKPEECVFIDDSPANAEGAIWAGMASVVFRGDASRLRRELREAGVRCREL